MKSTLFSATIAFTALIASISYSQIGGLDMSFSGDGKYTLDMGAEDQTVYAVAVQSDGKIVLAGENFNGSDDDAIIIRLNSDGTLDNTFDTDGIVEIDLAGEDFGAYDVKIQGDGKLVFTGFAFSGADGNFLAGRLNADGSLDNTFDTDGVREIDATGSGFEDQGMSLAIQSDGKILLVGNTDNGTNYDGVVIRLNTDGSLDTGFDGDGVVSADTGFEEFAYGIAIQPDDKIVVSGSIDLVTEYDVMLTRLNTDGSLDNTFDSDGVVITDIVSGSYEEGYFVLIQSDGKIVLPCLSAGPLDDDMSVLRYNIDGSLDASFDTDGIAVVDFGTNDAAYSAYEQTDGKLVIVGSTSGATDDFAIARLNTDGSLDVTFDTDGKVTTTLAADSEDEAYRGAIQSDGKILAVGAYYKPTPDETDIAVVRYRVTDNAVIPEFVLAENFIIYPNPAIQSTTFIFNENLANANMIIVNTLGENVLTDSEINGKTFNVNVENLPDGLYFCHILHDGNLIGEQKLVIQK